MVAQQANLIVALVAILSSPYLFSGILANSNITFQLSARGLIPFDPFGGYPDPYVNVTYENPPNHALPLGETLIIQDTQDPDWPDLFNIIHINGSTSQKLTFDVYDEDFDSDDYMGTVVVGLDEIVAAFGGFLERSIQLDNETVTGMLQIKANITEANS